MSELRYGIFLRPDPATCWNVTQVTSALNRQFGLVSAGAFPPHATIIGNLATRAAESDIISALDLVFEEVQPLPVYNAGVVRTDAGTLIYDVDLDASGTQRNELLNRVAATVKEAVLPLSVPVGDHLVTPIVDYVFAGHLGLASHELTVDGGLCDEVEDFIAGLPVVPPPASFVARWYSLIEFRADWVGNWWEHLTWRHRRSWEAVST
jgi:hypothetical protein